MASVEVASTPVVTPVEALATYINCPFRYATELIVWAVPLVLDVHVIASVDVAMTPPPAP
jgi:hypothetical protein